MNTITLVGYRRPGYMEEVISALLQCRQLSEFDLLYVSLDDHERTPEHLKLFSHSVVSKIPILLDVHPRKGVDSNNLHAFDRVVLIGSEFNVCLEDDTKPCVDALELALWTKPILLERQDLLCSCLYGGGGPDQDPSEAFLADTFLAWGWCFTRERFKTHIRPRWMRPVSWTKISPQPTGWDWSLTQIATDLGMKFITPRISRIRNIGRFDGEYCTPEQWDRELGSQHCSEGKEPVAEFKLQI